MAGDSATTDEPVHIAAGVEIARDGTGRWNPEHPPLAKALAGLALTGLDVRPADDPIANPSHAALLTNFLCGNRTPAETILFRARLPFVVLFLALLAAVRREARRRFGTVAGGVALAFAALDPNLLAHAGVVHTDLAVTLFLVLSLGPLARIPDAHDRLAPVALGVLWGLAFLSKYSAPLLVLVTLPLLCVADFTARDVARVGRRLLLSTFIASLVVLFGFSLAYRNQSSSDRDALARNRLLVKGRSPAAADFAVAAGRALPPLGNVAIGALSVALQNRVGGGPSYFMGRVSEGGSPWYFPVAFLVKVSLGLLAGAALGAFSPAGRRYGLFVSGALAAFFVLSAGSAYNIGVRHLLFAFPLLAILAGSAAPPESRFTARGCSLQSSFSSRRSRFSPFIRTSSRSSTRRPAALAADGVSSWTAISTGARISRVSRLLRLPIRRSRFPRSSSEGSRRFAIPRSGRSHPETRTGPAPSSRSERRHWRSGPSSSPPKELPATGRASRRSGALFGRVERGSERSAARSESGASTPRYSRPQGRCSRVRQHHLEGP